MHPGKLQRSSPFLPSLLLTLCTLCVRTRQQFSGGKVHHFFYSIFQGTPKKDKEPLAGPQLVLCRLHRCEQGKLEGWRCSRYLGGSHHRRCGRHVQASLPEVHEGIITPVFCLNKAIIDFLSKEKQRHAEWEGSDGSLFFLPSPEAWAWHPAQSQFSPGIKSRASWGCV